MSRLGTVCMLLDSTTKKNLYTIGTVTQKAMSQKTTKLAQKQHLLAKVKQNLSALSSQVKHIASLPEHMHCFRISSNLLPLYDHPEYGAIYKQDDVAHIVQTSLQRTGQFIKQHNLTVGMHPDQYCVLNSKNPDVVKKSIGILEYHADIGLMMGLAEHQWNSNIHLYAKNDDLSGLQDLRSYTRNTLSFENGDTPNRDMDAEATLNICQQHNIRGLFDMHHHRVVTGELLLPSSELVQAYIASWKGSEPLFHVSQGKEHPTDKRHSDSVTESLLVDAVQEYLKHGCVEVEAKDKNLAVGQLAGRIYNKQK